MMGGKPSVLENGEVVAIYREMIAEIKTYNNDLKIYFKGHHADKTNNFYIANNNQNKIRGYYSK
ncbi:MAG: hypothetical protein WBG90_14590 [Saonia sp.]